MIQIDLFNDDERQYLNSISKGHDRERLSREDILTAVSFAREVADSTDMMILDLIDGVYAKINSLSDDEWGELRMRLPFPVNISFEDDMENIPIDEDVVES